MKRIERLLVATDLSEGSRLALRRAAVLAAQHGATVEVLFVFRATPMLPDWLARAQPRLIDQESLFAELRGRLTTMAIEAGLSQERGLRLEVVTGRPAQAIADRAAEIRADLVLLGAHGETHALDALVGTTAQKTVRLSVAPVLVVRREASAPYARVLVATDFSESAAEAARMAAALASGAAFELFHAYDVPYFTLMTHAGVSDDAMGDYRRMAQQDAAETMARWVAGLGQPFTGWPVRLRHGYAPPLTQQHAAEHDIELVAVGHGGKGPLGSALLGSVSSRMLSELRCDLLVVREPS
jgi:nucleotide-binding universal stress UspA family protein